MFICVHQGGDEDEAREVPRALNLRRHLREPESFLALASSTGPGVHYAFIVTPQSENAPS